MEDEFEHKAGLLEIALRVFAFAEDHPLMAAYVLGAIGGSALTYKVLEYQTTRQKVSNIFKPKVYEIALPPEALRDLMMDPSVELRWETPTVVVVLTAEQREALKQLPDIDGTYTEG